MKPKRVKETERKREALKVSCLPLQGFCFNFSWNSVVLFRLHLLPAAVAFVCICCDIVQYQLGYTLILTSVNRNKTVWDRNKENVKREWARRCPSQVAQAS